MSGRRKRGAVESPESWAGKQFRALREARNWSEEDLAERLEAFGCKWSAATVELMEAGKRSTRFNEVARIATVFDLKLADFLADAPMPRPRCLACNGEPPPGFTCNACGISGEPKKKRPSPMVATTEACGVTITQAMAKYLVNELLPPYARLQEPILGRGNSAATHQALQKRGLIMADGNAGPGGIRLTDKGKDAAQVLVRRLEAGKARTGKNEYLSQAGRADTLLVATETEAGDASA